MCFRMLIMTVFLAAMHPTLAQETTRGSVTNWPGYQERDDVINDYKFISGESLSDVKLHSRTIGKVKRNSKDQ